MPAVAAALLGTGLVTALVARSETPSPAPRTRVAGASFAGAARQAAPPAGQKQGAPSPAPKTTATPPQPAGAATYVGDAVCIDCHTDQKKSYQNTLHGRQANPRSPAANRGCETCHGPGSIHADDPTSAASGIRVFSKLPAREVSDTCMTCHNRQTHVLWDGSVHDSRGVSCVTCHSVHSFKSERAQLKTPTEFGTCGTCHRDKVAKLDRSGHMPLREGKMECSTCHNPHGSTNVRLLRKGDSIAEMCTSCHADKRGPYLWEHAPARDGCVTCHDPHGSSNERMLVAKPPILCQRCHVSTRHPSTIYDGALIGSGVTPSIRVYVRSCVICHSNIHGSNHPSGQRFIR
jgi:DmsE family decaheme c-type cytochrome